MKKILLIRFSSIGDIVLTTPVVRCLRQQLGVEVHYLTKRSFQEILTPNPYINKVYAIEKRVGEVLPQLKKEGYDAIVDLHKNLRSQQVNLGLTGVKRYTFSKLNLEKWLMVRFKIDRLPDLHIVDRYLEAVSPLGIQNDDQGLDYFIPVTAQVKLEDLSERLGGTMTGDAPTMPVFANTYLAFAIGAAHATKRLPAEKISAICRKLPLPVILLGGPADQAAGRQIASAAGDHVLNACGALSLHQSASVVRQARLVISHDTGLMHIAAAFRKPILSIWGNTIPQFGMYPYLPAGFDAGKLFEVDGLSCRPCSKIGYASCPKGHFDCMQHIRETAIIQEVEHYLKQGVGGGGSCSDDE